MNHPRFCARCRHVSVPAADNTCLVCASDTELSSGNLKVLRDAAMVNRLIDLHPLMANCGYGPHVFTHALELNGAKPDGAAVVNMCELVVSAAAAAAHHSAQVAEKPRDGGVYSFVINPEWSPGEVLAMQLLTAGLNRDSDMVAGLVAAAIADRDGMDALEVLVEVLWHLVGAAAEALRVARTRHAATS